MQRFLLVSPDSGALIRGGARVIYYWHKPKQHLYLIYGYLKSKREDLTPQQVKVLAALMNDLADG